MQSSEEEEEELPVEEAAPPRRGRPAGRTDEKPRYRRTAQQISEDKIRIAEMKLQAVRDAEAKKVERKAQQLAERKAERKATRDSKPTTVSERPLKPALKQAPPTREEEPPSPPPRSRRAALYDSWFPSSPRSSRY